jgi:hypothetical protein
VNEMAKARSLGTEASIWSRRVSSTGMLGGLVVGPDLVGGLYPMRREGLHHLSHGCL